MRPWQKVRRSNIEMLPDWLRIFVQVGEVSTFIHQTDGSISTTEVEV